MRQDHNYHCQSITIATVGRDSLEREMQPIRLGRVLQVGRVTNGIVQIQATRLLSAKETSLVFHCPAFVGKSYL